MNLRVLKLTLVFAVFSFVVSNAQNAKKFFKSGEKFLEIKNYKDAINSFTSAINTDPNYDKAYVARATCYEALGDKEKALADYERAIIFMPKEKDLYCKAGRLYYELGDYDNADKRYKKVLELDGKYPDAVSGMIAVLQKTKKFHEALKFCEIALDEKKNAVNYFNMANTLDSLKSFEEAEKNYKQSKYYDSKYIIAYVGLANVQVKLNKKDEALATCEAAFLKEPNNIEIFKVRSKVYAAKNEYQNAVNDMTKVVVANPGEEGPYLLRADYYQKLGQYQNAIADYTKALQINPKNPDSYYKRAGSYEQMLNYKQAAKDYEYVMQLLPRDANAAKLMEDVKKKLYEFNKESNKPEILLSFPKPDSRNVLKVAGNLEEIVLSGIIEDASHIKNITVNSSNATFNKDTLNPDFSVSVKLSNLKEIKIEAEDIYSNKRSIVYSIERTEIEKPVVVLLAPYSSFDNEVFLDNDSPELYVEGKIKDESLISSVIVDGYVASFPLDKLNPTFSAKINIANKNKFVVNVKDINGNETIQEYKINRSGVNAAAENPMGTTWVVFVENANYQSFASLEGPTKDIRLIKSTLANYKVSNIIHKKDMTKSEMEKFFSIELRDLLKSNNVQSVMIWYAGHGKLINETGYWVPVDAKVDEEITYFNIGSLKAYLQNYTRVVHTLIVTDACESGPTFLLAMRGDKEEKRCEDWTATRFKSAQVLTSAGFELAADNSQFAKIFAGALSNNPDACIPIDKIYLKIKETFSASGKQEPKFGKIKDMSDEEGSFFFIKKQ